jgi:hypothetical protein
VLKVAEVASDVTRREGYWGETGLRVMAKWPQENVPVMASRTISSNAGSERSPKVSI